MRLAAMLVGSLAGAAPAARPAPHAGGVHAAPTTTPPSSLRFEIVVPRSLRAEPLTGRAFIFVSRDSTPEPRLQAGGMVSVPFFGTDVEQLPAGASAVVDARAVGYPLRHLDALRAGDYYVQAMISVYTRFARADGHTIWAHMDEWEGQGFNTAPGTLLSGVRRIHVDPASHTPIRLELSRMLPPVQVPPDDRYVKRIRIESPILTKWWGHPMYLGAVIFAAAGIRRAPGRAIPDDLGTGTFHACGALWLQVGRSHRVRSPTHDAHRADHRA
jgi:hypothetical protein